MNSPPKDSGTAERAAFEAWAYSFDYSLEGTSIKGRSYSSENTEHALRGWMAARAAPSGSDDVEHSTQ